MYNITKSQDESRGVLVLSYLCKLLKKTGSFEVNGEAGRTEFQKFEYKDIAGLYMPQFYKDAIAIARSELLCQQE